MNQHIRTIVYAFVLAQASFNIYAEEATPQGGATTVNPTATAPTLTAAQQAQADTLSDAITTELNAQYAAAADKEMATAAWDDINKQLEGSNTAAVIEMMQGYKTSNGAYQVNKIGDIPLFGSARIEASLLQNKRDLYPEAYGYPAANHKVIEATGNVLDEANRKLKNQAQKLSKFSCGNFDWIAQLKGKFNAEALKNYVTDLSESAIAAAPMALLATWSPTLYEIVKWLRQFAAGELDMQAAKCERMEASLTDIGKRVTRNAGYPDCMRSHKDIDYTEANKICNPGGSSAFDGMENYLGKIKGLSLPSQSFDVVKEGSDSYLQSLENSGTSIGRVAAAQKQLDDANAILAQNPDPGAPPAETNPNFHLWVQKKTNFEDASKAVAQATANRDSIAENNDVSIWSNIGYGIAKNAKNIFGSIKVSFRADVDIGHQDKYMIRLFMQHHGFVLQSTLIDYLEQHFKILVSRYELTGLYTSDDLRQSYKGIMICILRSMELRGDKPGQFTDESTIDKMAFLHDMKVSLAGDSEALTIFENSYRIDAHIRNVTCYEVARFANEKWQKERSKLLDSIKMRLTVGQNPDIKNVMEVVNDRAKELDEAYAECESLWRDRLLETLPYINKFKFVNSRQTSHGQGSSNYAPVPAIPEYYMP